MKLVVMIPAYNEESTIPNVIRSVRQTTPINTSILVIDDGSRDNTARLAREAGAEVISHGNNKGLGIAFRTGINHALSMQADIIVNIDADGQFNPADIQRLVQPIIEDKADMVTCSRFLERRYIPRMPWIKKFGNNLITSLINFLTGKRFTDSQCGFRVYSREAALRLNLFGEYTYTQEVFLDLLNKGFRIKEVPCRLVQDQRKGKSRLYRGWFSYGTRVLLIIIRSIRDYRPLKFFGLIGLLTMLLGFVIEGILFIRWLLTSFITPYRSLLLLGITLIILGFLLMILALIADMLARERKLQEEILYRLKKNG